MPPTLIIFAREPVAGRSKTRLCPPLEPTQAAALYRAFLEDTLEQACRLPRIAPCIAFTPDSDPAFFARLAPELPALLQQGETLGERMANAFEHVFAQLPQESDTPIVLIGSDFPSLPDAALRALFELLETADVTLGPTDDGGYYGIGLRRPQPALLREVTMSTPDVLRDTLALAAREKLRVALAPRWYDVDTAQDLARLYADFRIAPPETAPRTRALLATNRFL